MVSAMNTQLPQHWDAVYSSKGENERSWTEQSPHESLRYLALASSNVDGSIIDIGGGASHFVDALLTQNFTDITLLDISAPALDETRNRLHDVKGSSNISYICTDITTWQPNRTFTVWHDRAVFHFLTDPNDRKKYLAAARAGIQPKGYAIIATFSPGGPESCSGLPVQQWSAADLAAEFADGFTLVESSTTEHITPWGGVQPFTWVLLQRTS